MRTLYDSIEADNIPADALFCAGYTSGEWPDYEKMRNERPNATVLRIAIDVSHDGDVLDVERGDATPEDAPVWVARQRSLGRARPIVYCNESTWPDVKVRFPGEGEPEPDYWIADPTGAEHLVEGSVMTQWGQEGGCDLSAIADGYIFGEGVTDMTDAEKQAVIDGVHTVLDELFNNQFTPRFDKIDSEIAALQAAVQQQH